MNAEMKIAEITKQAESLRDKSPRKCFHKIGTYGRQGDIYIHPVQDTHPKGKQTSNMQLAVGESKGSRHVAEGDVKVYLGTTIPEGTDRTTFLGPVIEVGKNGATITHPEHAHVQIMDPGCYQITHQRDAISLERVKD